MNKKFKLIILLSFSTVFSIIFSNSANAQVRVDNFNVLQRNISSTPSNIDFRLTISQQDQSLDCSNLPLTNGDLEWIVWYVTKSGNFTFVQLVRRQSVGLPLSPNPRNLDFSETITPSARAIKAGSVDFYAAIGCTTSTSKRSENLAVSAPVQVNIQGGGGGGGGTGGGGGGGTGKTTSVSFEIPNPIQAKSLVDLAKAIGRFLLQIAIPIAVIIIIYSGLLFLTSGGNKDRVAKARTALLYAVVGLTIILIGQGFFTLIKSILDLGS